MAPSASQLPSRPSHYLPTAVLSLPVPPNCRPVPPSTSQLPSYRSQYLPTVVPSLPVPPNCRPIVPSTSQLSYRPSQYLLTPSLPAVRIESSMHSRWPNIVKLKSMMGNRCDKWPTVLKVDGRHTFLMSSIPFPNDPFSAELEWTYDKSPSIGMSVRLIKTQL